MDLHVEARWSYVSRNALRNPTFHELSVGTESTPSKTGAVPTPATMMTGRSHPSLIRCGLPTRMRWAMTMSALGTMTAKIKGPSGGVLVAPLASLKATHSMINGSELADLFALKIWVSVRMLAVVSYIL